MNTEWSLAPSIQDLDSSSHSRSNESNRFEGWYVRHWVDGRRGTVVDTLIEWQQNIAVYRATPSKEFIPTNFR